MHINKKGIFFGLGGVVKGKRGCGEREEGELSKGDEGNSNSIIYLPTKPLKLNIEDMFDHLQELTHMLGYVMVTVRA